MFMQEDKVRPTLIFLSVIIIMILGALQAVMLLRHYDFLILYL